MAKKKTVKKKKSDNEFTHAAGTPTMMLLPARNYKFKVYKKEYSIIIPKTGVYADLDKDMFSKKDGEFDLLQTIEEDNEQVMYVPSLSKVLFATDQYPDLEDTQAFAPMAIIIRENEVEIIGSIIQMIKED